VATYLPPCGVVSSFTPSGSSRSCIFAMLARARLQVPSAGLWLFLICFAIPSASLAETIPSLTTQTYSTVPLKHFPAHSVSQGCSTLLHIKFDTATEAGASAFACQQYLTTNKCIYGDGHFDYAVYPDANGKWYYVASGPRYNCDGYGTYFTYVSVPQYPANGCPDGFTNTGTNCVKTTYTCPPDGGWILSSDRQTCSRCPDPAKPILTPEGACIGAPDKATGNQDCQSSSSNSSDPFLE